ncbi:addiction module protein [Microcoleus sp. F10-C6]|uniref:addiction module protein n=1 Tax=unclassified Microcoleus TaxID=2642155 RepID=UPI002FD05F3B
MDLAGTLAEIISLSVNDRIRLVQAIWDSISADPEHLELTESQRIELSRRLLDHETNPNAVISWKQVKARTMARLQQ